MRNRGKLAGIALAVNVICGILGLGLLAALGVKAAGGTALVLPETAVLVPAFYILLAVMAVSMIVMVAAIPKKR